MNLHRQSLLLMLATALLLMGSGCSVPQRVDAPRSQLTVSQARKSLGESLNQLVYHNAVREVKITRHQLSFVANNTLDGEKPIKRYVTFAEQNNLEVVKANQWFLVNSNGEWLFFFKTEPDALKFVDAVLILKAAALAPDREESDFAAFAVEAGIWLVATSKAEMPDDARGYRALAKEAVERKDFPAALEAYRDTLDRFPMWPQGQYNAAQLAAEAEDYELAARHMRRYIVLAPDASDVAEAKDKYFLWQLKAGQAEHPAGQQLKLRQGMGTSNAR